VYDPDAKRWSGRATVMKIRRARRFSVAQDGQWSHIGPKSTFPEATGHTSAARKDNG
jgi:hypothetical protein